MQRDCDLEAWRMFCAVAQTGSISAACDVCNSDASNISRIISALEKSMGGITLFDRSVRPLALTDNGRIALGYAQQMLEAHDAMMNAVDTDPTAMRGVIRLGLPPAALQDFLLPTLVSFNEKYPDIILDVSENKSSFPINFDTAKGRLDIIVGYGPDASHPNIVQIHYGDSVFVSCASPTYIATHGKPKDPTELVNHTGVIFESTMRSGVQALTKDGKSVNLKWKREMHFDSAISAKNATMIGAGIHPGIPSLHCYKELAAGKLVPVLTDWRAPAVGLYIYTRPECMRLRRVKVFIDWFTERMHALHVQCAKDLHGVLPEDLADGCLPVR